MKAPSVLLVAGAYYPEISAAGLQCQAVASVLRGRARMSVLVTAVDPSLPSADRVDDVAVTRVGVDVRSRVSKASASIRLIAKLAGLLPAVDVIHIHGVSQKNVPIALMAHLLRKPVVLTLHTSGQDEPQVADQRGRLSSWAFRSARLVLPVSPNLVRRCTDAGMPADRVRLTPNGIDTERFRPATLAERSALRRDLGWADDTPVVMFVGFFSHDKRPDVLFRAWRRLADQGVRSTLVYVGATASPYFEIDEAIAREIRERAAAMGRASDVVFVEPTHAMDRYYRAADVFVLSSVREGNPVALLEAMACGLPCIASRIDGATDAMIESGSNGRLVDRDDVQGLARTLGTVLAHADEARRLGQRARDTVVNRFDIQQTAERWLDAYRTVCG
jgi:glycosyltransferase involved in cell wall biosynthesis